MSDIPTVSLGDALLLAEGLARYRANGWPTEEIGGTSPRAAAIICALASEVLITRRKLAVARRLPRTPIAVVHFRSPDDDDGQPWCRLSKREVPDVSVDDVTCRACLRRISKPDKPSGPGRWPGPWDPERDAKITELVNDGRKLGDVGAMFGLTRERVRQIAKRGGATPPLERIRREHAERVAERVAENIRKNTHQCVVCRKTFVSNGKRVACDNDDCQWIFRHGKRYVTASGFEQWRQAQARRMLRNPDRYRANDLARAEKVIAGTAPPGRRWVTRDSKIAAALRRVGREDLLPPPSGGLPRSIKKTSFMCPATNLNGTACKRGVWTEGELCVIHSGRAGTKARRAS